MRNANPSPGGNSENVVFGDRTRVLTCPPSRVSADLNFAAQNVPPLTGKTPDIPLPYRGGDGFDCSFRLGYRGLKGGIGGLRGFTRLTAEHIFQYAKSASRGALKPAN